MGSVLDYRWLPKEELLDVIFGGNADSSELFIAAAADEAAQAVAIIRGDLQTMLVPFSNFETSGDGTAPDFSKPTPTDYGRTLALGPYEASADAILYEVDPAYRIRMHRAQRAEDRTFGASLRRLRKQRKLGRDDFTPLSAKTIARLEQNQIAKPHSKTLSILSARLGVKPEEIATY